VDDFLVEENLRHFRQLLERTTDEATRRTILWLIEEFEQKKDGSAGSGGPAAS
jgi:hypothetical protein